ncbi:hypothetical protein [Sediminibacterium ginsengisoli]|nr:hypothetical protein [Sediminibacterium ginsengisoli]
MSGQIETDQLREMPAMQFTETVISRVYPVLFGQVSGIGEYMQQLFPGNDERIYQSLLNKIYSELDDQYRKEKLVLFPFILQLQAENKLAESCKPFKSVKTHYTSMLVLLTEIRENLRAGDVIPVTGSIQELVNLLQVFEKNLVAVHVTKDKYLFAPFRSCKGCKSL